MLVVVADDGEIAAITLPPLGELVHRLGTRADEAAEAGHVFARGVVDVAADLALKNEIVGGIGAEERNPLMAQSLIIAADVLDGHRRAGGAKDVLLLETVLLQPGDDERQADRERTTGDEAADFIHPLVREPREREGNALVGLEQGDLGEGVGTEIAHPDGAEIDLLIDAGMGNRLEHAIGVSVAALVNEDADALIAGTEGKNAVITGMPGDEGAAADPADDDAVIDQALESLADGEEIALVRDGEVTLSGKFGPERKRPGKLAELRLDTLIFKLSRTNFHDSVEKVIERIRIIEPIRECIAI